MTTELEMPTARKAQPNQRLEKVKKIYRKSLWALHRRMPNHIPPPDGWNKEYYKNRDAKDNLGTQVPEDETLDVCALWGAELYGPAEIDGLYANMRRLGWATPSLGRRETAVDWISEQRMYGSEGTYNLGIIAPKGTVGRWQRDYTASLPKEVEYLIVTIYQLTASLTCVLIAFVLSEEAGGGYRRKLSEDLKTTRVAEPGRSAVSIWDVGNQKIKVIEATRGGFRQLVTNWFSEQLPGFFSASLDGNKLPTAELITTEVEHCFADVEREIHGSFFNWRKIILNPHFHSTWISASCKGLQFVMDALENEERFHIVVALKSSDLTEKHLESRGERGRHAYFHFSHDHVEGILGHYAAIALLREALRTVKLSREKLKPKNFSKSVLQVLESIRVFFTGSMGLTAIASELAKKSEHPTWIKHYCEEFTQEFWPDKSDIQHIATTLSERTKYLAERLLSEQSSAREEFEQIASILNTRESVKAQRRMEVLTFVALVVAFGSLFAALPSPSDWSKALGPLVQVLQGSRP